LAEDVVGDLAAPARAQGVEVALAVRSRDPLSGRDRRRWRYLLVLATTAALADLPAGTHLRIELRCVATTSGHRWLQADLAVTRGEAAAGAPGWRERREGFRSTVVDTALRLLEGASDGTVTAEGRILRLVAPVEA
jgi:hypothetical protein